MCTTKQATTEPATTERVTTVPADWRPALVSRPNGTDAEPFVLAPTDVELLPADHSVTVFAVRGYNRREPVQVPAGRIALYDPALYLPAEVTDLHQHENYLAWCAYCGIEMEPTGPGDHTFPVPAELENQNAICPAHPRKDRPRPHLAVYYLVNLLTMQPILPGDGFPNRREHQHAEARRIDQERTRALRDVPLTTSVLAALLDATRGYEHDVVTRAAFRAGVTGRRELPPLDLAQPPGEHRHVADLEEQTQLRVVFWAPADADLDEAAVNAVRAGTGVQRRVLKHTVLDVRPLETPATPDSPDARIAEAERQAREAGRQHAAACMSAAARAVAVPFPTAATVTVEVSDGTVAVVAVDDAAGIQLWELMEGEIHTALTTAGALLTSALRFCTPEECGWVPGRVDL
ncbi:MULTISPECIES: hypothetical protein [Saccharothrix]|uniref:hypothetical protein n=1 Tax=Saccharothrix TaxID=2071 RepID=UPI00093BF572|nr:hypothetical protein [Saccharothrix sp. CB00851]OKI35292.1 hypothetical protein A6A25_24440 [Saccharothrix sp. CB00851]